MRSILPPRCQTQRLILRPLAASDRDAFARMNADPRVMRYFPGTLSRAQSDALFEAMEKHLESHGFAPWAVERPDVDGCMGVVGLAVPSFESHFTPCVEIVWRLSAEHWGQGYAQEAARAALHAGFVLLGLKQIVSFTAMDNDRSRRVMSHLGMRHDPAEDFDHPNLPQGHPLRPHVLYRLDAGAWRTGV